jgi:hypothetical protein
MLDRGQTAGNYVRKFTGFCALTCGNQPGITACAKKRPAKPSNFERESGTPFSRAKLPSGATFVTRFVAKSSRWAVLTPPAFLGELCDLAVHRRDALAQMRARISTNAHTQNVPLCPLTRITVFLELGSNEFSNRLAVPVRPFGNRENCVAILVPPRARKGTKMEEFCPGDSEKTPGISASSHAATGQ